MAEVTITSDLEKQKWLSQYYEEYIRESGFKPYIGRSAMKVIHARYELQEESGKTINIPLITRLTNDGVTGSQMLDGAEEDMGVFNCPLSIDWRRNGVRVPKSTSYKTEIDLWGAAKDLLRSWEAEKLRDDIIESMMRVERAVNYGASSTTTKNNWLAANSDRVLYGAVISNHSSLVNATALSNVDTASDKLTTATASLARRIARSANPHIRPFRSEVGREFYVLFCGARAFRDIKLDSNMVSANRDARAREGAGGEAYMDNPLFVDGDLWYDGILFHEVPEIDDIAAQTGYFNNAGSGGNTDVRPCFLCGAQAVGIAWGQTPEMRTDTQKDYQFRPGVAIEELLEVDKLFFGTNATTTSPLKQHGMVTLYVAAAADS
jgi:N4-gp56 family major capsid protein